VRQACPHCARPLDSEMGVAPKGGQPARRPKPGDVAVCIGCAGLLVFTPALRRRKMTYAEELEILDDPELRKMLEHCRASVRGLPTERVPM
jgi:hypothetical protein